MSSSTPQRYEPNGISVIISGSGVGGLMAALECWRKGCDVQIFERAESRITTGDSFTIGPSALNAFKHWPDLVRENEEIAYEPLVSYHKLNGERIAGPQPLKSMLSEKTVLEKTPTKVYRHSRPKFHAMLLRQLCRIGIEVQYGKEVVEYSENLEKGQAAVILRDGSRWEADIVIAADGLRSASQELIAGHSVPARSSGAAMFRAAFPVEYALADPMVAERFKLLDNGRSIIEMWSGTGIYGAFWRNEDEMTFGISYEDPIAGEESWNQRVEPSALLAITSKIPDWPEVADRVIKTAPPGVLVNWKLMWRDPQPRWTSPGGRVVQLGDAAHAFLPTSGNGGTQAMEDAVSLATCLQIAGKEDVASATRVHSLLRFERVSLLQAFGIGNHFALARRSDERAASQKKPNMRLGKWILDHDPERNAEEKYEQAFKHLLEGVPFENSNLPPGLVYQPWTIDSLVDDLKSGRSTILDSGDWS